MIFKNIAKFKFSYIKFDNYYNIYEIYQEPLLVILFFKILINLNLDLLNLIIIIMFMKYIRNLNLILNYKKYC